MPRIVLKETDTEKTLSVADSEAVLGRDPTCGFLVEGPNSKVVSGRHARIFFQDGAWWIEDTSRNGTVVDEERLQPGQRHALRVGQLIGLGETGPRFRVAALESRKVAETMMELPEAGVPEIPPAPVAASYSAPAQAAAVGNPVMADASTTAMRRSEGIRAGLHIEATEPMTPGTDWLVKATLRSTSTNQRFAVDGQSVKLGRSPECKVQIPPELGASVSRVHAELTILDGGVVVRDAGSRNGTFVNGKRIEGSQAVARNDLIMLGSGGPTFSIEDLHIVKGQSSSLLPAAEDITPAEAKPGGPPAASIGGSPTDPPTTNPRPALVAGGLKPMGPAANLARRSFAGAGRTAFFKDVLEEMSQKSARRVRIIVWASVAATIAIAGLLLGVTQWRVARTESRMAEERARLERRADSIRVVATAEAARLRSAFDSARVSSAPRAVLDSLRDALADASRRTGALEASLARARTSLDQQLQAGDIARRKAEEEMNRIRAQFGKASAGGEVGRATLDSLRRMLKEAEERANDVASQVRAVRGSNLAQVSQLNQGAVGLLVTFIGGRAVSGTGFAITPSGYFITNRHVVTDDAGRTRDTIYATMADDKFSLENRVLVVAVGANVDLAVVKIPNYRGPYMKKVDWAAAGANQGEPAALIGFPFGMDLAFDDTSSKVVRTSMSAGIFSKVSTDRIQFDGFTVGGSSGSPIFNSSGEVVAVHQAGLSAGPGLGFSIPISRVISLLPADAKLELGLK